MNKLFLIFALTTLTPIIVQAANRGDTNLEAYIANAMLEAKIDSTKYTLVKSTENDGTFYTIHGDFVGHQADLLKAPARNGRLLKRPGSPTLLLQISKQELAEILAQKQAASAQKDN